MPDLPRTLRWYLGAIYLACAALVTWQVSALMLAGARADTVVPWQVLVFMLLTLVSESTQLQLSGSLSQSLTTAVHITVILLFPAPYPVLITLGAVVASQARQRHKPLYKRLFNICHPTLVVGLSGALCTLIAAPTSILHPGLVVTALPTLSALLLLYYLFDVGTLLPVFVILQRSSPWRVWRQTYQSILLPEVAAGTIGLLAALAWHYDYISLALFIFPVVALRVAFRAIAQANDQASMLQRRSDQLEAVLAAGQHLRLQLTRKDLMQPVVEAARTVANAGAVEAYVRDEASPGLLTRVALAPAGTAEPDDAFIPIPEVAAISNEVNAARTLVLPLELAGQGLIGLLSLSGVAPELSRADHDTLTILATQAAIALANAHLLAQEKEARNEAETAVHIRDDFLSAASHDLRTPLTVISGCIQILQMRLQANQPVEPDWLAKQLRLMRDADRRMLSTVEEITDAAHLQMGQTLALNVTAIDLGEIVRGTAATVTTAWGHARSSEVLVHAPDYLVVQGDLARLERVVQNIVANAIKYSPDGTPVHVEARAVDDWAVITVRDSGVGIPEDEIPHVFTYFYRASTSIGIPGTGIGLAGAKTIVQQHGGHMTLESAVGNGTTITVYLPCVHSKRAAHEGIDALSARPPHGDPGKLTA